MKEIKLDPKVKGQIGEAIINTTYTDIPPPVEQRIIEYLEENHIGLTEEYDYSISQYWSDPPSYQIQGSETRYIWDPDAMFEAIFGEEELFNSFPGDRIRFPVEIKTGENAGFKRTQAETIKLLNERNGVQPLVLYLDVTGVPDAYEIDVEIL